MIVDDPVLMGMLACLAFWVVEHPVSVVFLDVAPERAANCPLYVVEP